MDAQADPSAILFIATRRIFIYICQSMLVLLGVQMYQ